MPGALLIKTREIEGPCPHANSPGDCILGGGVQSQGPAGLARISAEPIPQAVRTRFTGF
jgi:hypothetical protein